MFRPIGLACVLLIGCGTSNPGPAANSTSAVASLEEASVRAGLEERALRAVEHDLTKAREAELASLIREKFGYTGEELEAAARSLRATRAIAGVDETEVDAKIHRLSIVANELNQWVADSVDPETKAGQELRNRMAGLRLTKERAEQVARFDEATAAVHAAERTIRGR